MVTVCSVMWGHQDVNTLRGPFQNMSDRASMWNQICDGEPIAFSSFYFPVTTSILSFFDLWMLFSLSLFCVAGNALREDFSFRHTFSSEVAKLLKASPGQVVITHPEKFRSKYEPASHTLTVEVRISISV